MGTGQRLSNPARHCLTAVDSERYCPAGAMIGSRTLLFGHHAISSAGPDLLTLGTRISCGAGLLPGSIDCRLAKESTTKTIHNPDPWRCVQVCVDRVLPGLALV